MEFEFKEVDVLRDMTYSTHINDIRFTSEVFLSTGAYKPSLKIHILNQHSLKNERTIDNEAIRIAPLTDDGLKIALLRTDRYVDIHAKYGHHATFRLPYFADDMKYNRINCDLIFLGLKGIPVFNLNEGRFMESVSAMQHSAFALSSTNSLLACASLSHCDFIDFRNKKMVGTLERPNCVSLDFHDDGLHFSCTDEQNRLFVYDMRVNKPIYELEIEETGKIVRFNSDFVCVGGNSGVFLHNLKKDFLKPCGFLELNHLERFDFDCGLYAAFSKDSDKIRTFFCKGLGDAPQWCNSLDNDVSLNI